LASGRSAGGLPAGPRAARYGRACLIATGAGLALAGLVIVTLGSSWVFVPQDLEFIGLSRAELDRINPRLVPLIAHDRAGFGGGLLTTGVLVALCAWYARPSRAFSQAIALAGVLPQLLPRPRREGAMPQATGHANAEHHVPLLSAQLQRPIQRPRCSRRLCLMGHRRHTWLLSLATNELNVRRVTRRRLHRI
jgi:hypothetical protein